MLDSSGNAVTLNATFVLSSEDAEGALLSPRIVPGVDAGPVRSAVVNTPADQLDSVTAQRLSSDVLVNTRLVGFEILVDGEGNRDGALLHKFLLDVGDTLDGVRGRGEVLVLGVSGSVVLLVTGGGTLGGGVFLKSVAVHHVSRDWVNVVGATLHSVWLAGCSLANISVVSTSGNTVRLEPVPGTSGLTTVASHGEGAFSASAARNGVFWGENQLSITSLNAVSVIESLRGSERPATATVTLVSDTAGDRGTFWPVGADIEGFWDGIGVGLENSLLKLRGNVAFVSGQDSTQLTLDVSNSGVSKSGTDFGNPSSFHFLKIIPVTISLRKTERNLNLH